MSKKIFRFKSDAYGEKGELLPRMLKFLRYVPYTHVIEDQMHEKIELRVEIKVRHLKKLVSDCERLKIENSRLTANSAQQLALLALYKEVIAPDDLRKLQEDLVDCQRKRTQLESDLEVALHSAEKMNYELPRIQERIIQAYELSEVGSQFRTIFNREIQPYLKWPPLQGGAPGLKR